MASTSRNPFGLAATCMVLLAAGPAAGTELGPRPACSVAADCTAALYSHVSYQARRDVVASPGYFLGTFLQQGATVYQGSDVRVDSGLAEADDALPVVPPPVIINPWSVHASARAQTDFAVNRAWASSSRAVSGLDTQGDETAQIVLGTTATAYSAWQDVWSFSAPGHFSAPVAADGSSSLHAISGLYPSTYQFAPRAAWGDWWLQFNVWDMDNQSISEDFELGGPTLMARVTLRGNDEQRATFAEAATLEFDFLSGVTYVITSSLSSTVFHGRELDLFHTARLGAVTLGGGAVLTALSGHDFANIVPEPGPAALLLAGLATLALLKRRRLQ